MEQKAPTQSIKKKHNKNECLSHIYLLNMRNIGIWAPPFQNKIVKKCYAHQKLKKMKNALKLDENIKSSNLLTPFTSKTVIVT